MLSLAGRPDTSNSDGKKIKTLQEKTEIDFMIDDILGDLKEILLQR